MGLKLANTTSHRWIGCNETKCFPSGCPGNRFRPYIVLNDNCPDFMFQVVLLSNESRAIQSGDSVILKVKNLTSGMYMPLNCIPSEDRCALNTSYFCQPSNGSAVPDPRCLHQVFKIIVAGEREKCSLEHNDMLVLQDSAASSLSVDCNLRRKRKNCSLQTCTSPLACRRFIVYKLDTV